MVDGVGGDGENGALRKVVVTEGHAGAWGNDAGEAERGGGVDAEGFFDDVVKAGISLVSWRLEQGWNGT